MDQLFQSKVTRGLACRLIIIRIKATKHLSLSLSLSLDPLGWVMKRKPTWN